MLLKKIQTSVAKQSANHLIKYILPNDNVLDIGSGKGFVAKLISEQTGAAIKCMDVLNLKDSVLPVEKFDGIHIPYPDNSFSVVVVVFVLHHAENQIELLKNIKKVSSDRIIIIEDIQENIFDRMFAFLHKMSSYFIYQSKISSMKFRSDKDWKEVFGLLDLTLVNEETTLITNPLYPIGRKLYVLQKNSL